MISDSTILQTSDPATWPSLAFLVITTKYGPEIRLMMPSSPAMGFLLAIGGICPLFAWRTIS
jgi:hypothetical protein